MIFHCKFSVCLKLNLYDLYLSQRLSPIADTLRNFPSGEMLRIISIGMPYYLKRRSPATCLTDDDESVTSTVKDHGTAWRRAQGLVTKCRLATMGILREDQGSPRRKHAHRGKEVLSWRPCPRQIPSAQTPKAYVV